MYRYLNIRGESDYSKFLPVEDIFSCIANIPELSQLSDRSFDERLALGVAKSLDWEVVDANSSEVIREIESE